MIRPHYFDEPEPDPTDWQLSMAKGQGYVPAGCLLGGAVVMAEVNGCRNPCWGCNGPRGRCGGAEKREAA